MEHYPRSFEAFGFTIEVHAGGRRVWPPSFKQYIASKLDSGDLTVNQVMEACNASQSLVYKWRSDGRDSKIRSVAVRKERCFSEIVVEEDAPPSRNDDNAGSLIHLSGRKSSIFLPATYPVDDLVRIILALEGRA